MSETILDDENFETFAMNAYDNPQCSGIEEFREDIERIKYIKLLLRKYDRKGVLRERLILNHIIVLCNVFGPRNACRMMFFKIEPDLHSYIKTFLKYIGCIPESIPEVDLSWIQIDPNIQKALEAL
jgi:hypothetical protein